MIKVSIDTKCFFKFYCEDLIVKGEKDIDMLYLFQSDFQIKVQNWIKPKEFLIK